MAFRSLRSCVCGGYSAEDLAASRRYTVQHMEHRKHSTGVQAFHSTSAWHQRQVPNPQRAQLDKARRAGSRPRKTAQDGQRGHGAGPYHVDARRTAAPMAPANRNRRPRSVLGRVPNFFARHRAPRHLPKLSPRDRLGPHPIVSHGGSGTKAGFPSGHCAPFVRRRRWEKAVKVFHASQLFSCYITNRWCLWCGFTIRGVIYEPSQHCAAASNLFFRCVATRKR